jgi:O-antigen/teichoic acid export membrane protein
MVIDLALVAYRQVDVIVISQVASSRDVGWYSTADVLAGSLLFPTTVILMSAFPTFGRLHKEDPVRLRELVRQAFSLLFVVSVPIGLGAAVVGPTFAPLLYGDQYDGTGTLMMIFGPVTILTFGTTLIATVALATGRKRFLAVLLTSMALLTVPLDLVLVPWAAERYDNGAIGGALAYLVTETLQFVIGLAMITPYLVTRAWAIRSAKVLLAGAIMVAAVWPIREAFFLVPALVGALVYPLAVLLLRVLDDSERALVGRSLRRLGLRTPWA